MKKDNTLIVSQDDTRIPSIAVSEELIRHKAPTVIQILTEYNALDLVEILGLTSHMEGSN